MTEAELYTTYKGIKIPASYFTPQSQRYFEDFTFRPDDVIIATYPKSGQLLLFLLFLLIRIFKCTYLYIYFSIYIYVNAIYILCMYCKL